MMRAISPFTWLDTCEWLNQAVDAWTYASQSRTAFPFWSFQEWSLCATRGTILTIGCVYGPFEVLKVTTRTFPFGPEWICLIQVKGHMESWDTSPLTPMMSPTVPWCSEMSDSTWQTAGGWSNTTATNVAISDVVQLGRDSSVTTTISARKFQTDWAMPPRVIQ